MTDWTRGQTLKVRSFDLAINLKTAKTLGIVVPSSLAALAGARVE